MSNNYTPPTPEDLKELRDKLGLTQAQMAKFVGLAGDWQWRKYTGGKSPRNMSMHMLFYISAKLVLDDKQIRKITEKMEEIKKLDIELN